MRIERQLAVDDERSDEDDPGSAIGREPAGEVQRMLGLLSVEQRHHDAAIGPHLMRWYGTEARITFGSTSSSRFT